MVLTLVEAGKRYQNGLVDGVAETISITDKFQGLIPMIPVVGNAVTYNYDNSLGDVQFLDYNAEITATSTSTVNSKTISITRIIGQATVDNLMNAAKASASASTLIADEIVSKARSVALKTGDKIINGSGSYPEINGLAKLVEDDMTLKGAGEVGSEASRNLSFELLDELADKITGEKFFVMNSAAFRKIKTLHRSFGGATPEYVQVGGLSLPVYDGHPIFINDNVSRVETGAGLLTGGASTSIYCGRFDDGSMKQGLAMIYPNKYDMGIEVLNLGPSHTTDGETARVARYFGLGLFNPKALARLAGIDA